MSPVGEQEEATALLIADINSISYCPIYSSYACALQVLTFYACNTAVGNLKAFSCEEGEVQRLLADHTKPGLETHHFFGPLEAKGT